MTIFSNILSSLPSIFADAGLSTIAQTAGQQYDPAGATWQSRLQNLASLAPQALQQSRDNKFYGDMMAANPDFATQYFQNIDAMNRTKLAEREMEDESARKAAKNAAYENLSKVLTGGNTAVSAQAGTQPNQSQLFQALAALDPEMTAKIALEAEMQQSTPQYQLAQMELEQKQGVQSALSSLGQPQPVQINDAAGFERVPSVSVEELYRNNMNGKIPDITPPMNGMEALARAVPTPITVNQVGEASAQPIQPAPELASLAEQRDRNLRNSQILQQQAEALAAVDPAMADSKLSQARSEAEAAQKAQDKIDDRLKAESETAEAKEKRAQALLETAYKIKTVMLPEIKRAKDTLKKPMTSGPAAQATSWIGGTPAFDVDQSFQVLRSDIGLGKLMEMKELSSTGASGLGPLNKEELRILIDSQGSLNIGLSDERKASTLDKQYKKYNRLYDNLNAGYKEITGKDLPAIENGSGDVVDYMEYFQ